MKPTRDKATLDRRYAMLGVTVTKVLSDLEGYLIADQFCCNDCGTIFSPASTRQRNRYMCPNGYNNKE